MHMYSVITHGEHMRQPIVEQHAHTLYNVYETYAQDL